VLQTPQFVPATLSVFQLIDRFRHSPVHFALVLDEFGAIEGLVTPTDVLESLVGEIPSEPDAAAGPITTREDGSWLVDGAMPFEDLVAELSLTPLPDEEEGAYQTLAGFVMTRLARVPRAGDRFAWGDLRFEVVDMDGRRVDKVLIERVPTATPSGA
jgi:putative hemolysin